jgi:hypothetical protein
MTAVMHFVTDEHDPWGLVAGHVAELAPGSYLALSHLTLDSRRERPSRRGASLARRT